MPEGAVASDTEIERIRTDTEGWRSLAIRVLAQVEPGDLRDKDIDFLEQIPKRQWLEELSRPQAKYLLDLEDSVTPVSSFEGRSITWMIESCLKNLAGLEEGENEEEEKDWIKTLAQQRPETLRRHEAARLHSLEKKLRKAS